MTLCPQVLYLLNQLSQVWTKILQSNESDNDEQNDNLVKVKPKRPGVEQSKFLVSLLLLRGCV